MSNFDHASAKVRSMLDFAEHLCEFGCRQDFPIPQIVVVGNQSSGKSSVLESISGIPFPRGIGMVTTCATQISMRQTLESTPESIQIQVIDKYDDFSPLSRFWRFLL